MQLKEVKDRGKAVKTLRGVDIECADVNVISQSLLNGQSSVA